MRNGRILDIGTPIFILVMMAFFNILFSVVSVVDHAFRLIQKLKKLA